MKRTGKKLLSFILAVVMVVTSCSVGITAFAEEVNPDAAYWNNTTKAEDAYKSIESLVDTLVPTILGIEISEGTTIGSLLGMTEEEIKSAELTTVVEKASPLLMGLLGGSSSSQEDFLVKHSSITGIESWKAKYSKYYSYLDGTSADTMTFYALYEFCEDNVNNKDEEFANYCKDLVGYTDDSGIYHEGKLEALLKIASVAEKAYDSKITAADSVYQKTLLGYNTGTKRKPVYPIKNAVVAGKTAEEIGQLEVKYNNTIYKIDELPLTDSDGNPTDIADGITICNEAFEALGLGDTIKAETPAEALVYYYSNSLGSIYTSESQSLSLYQAALYVSLAEEGGNAIKAADGTDLTVDNFISKLGGDLTKPLTIASGVYNQLFDLSSVNYNNLTLDTFASSSYEAINKAVLLSSGDVGSTIEEVTEAVEDAKITDEQLEILGDVAVSGNPDVLQDYIQNGVTCPLSDYAKNLLLTLATSNKSDFSLFNNAVATSVSEANKYQSTYFAEGAAARNNGSNTSLVAYINDIISGAMTQQIIGAGQSIGSIAYVSRSSVDYQETQKYNNAIKPATDGHSYNYSDYAVPEKYTVDAVNSMLNNTIASLFTGSTGAIVNPIIEALLETNVVLYKEDGSGVLNNIWNKLYDAPIATIIDLIPVLTALVDEVVVPMVLNAEGDAKYENLNFLLDDADTLLGQYALKNGNTEIGVTTTSFDLNTIIPAILAIVSADGGYESAHAIVNTYSEYITKYNEGKSEEQKIIIIDPEFDGDVLKITGVYVADQFLTEFTNSKISSMISDALKKTGKLDDTQVYGLTAGIMEALNTVIDNVDDDVQDYLANHQNDVRYVKEDETSDAQISQRGLNNIAVSLPYLMNSIGTGLLKHLGVESDWTTIYDGKFVEVSKTFKNETVTQVSNASLEELKSYASTTGHSADILESLLDTAVGTWIDSIIDLANDVISTDNKISSNLALITGLLNSLGGLGEQSIITDILNGFFDLTREDDASFTLKENDKGFVGLSTESAMFLISNINYKDSQGNSKGLIPLIKGLIAGGDNQSSTTADTNSTEDNTSPTLANSSKMATATTPSSSEVEAADAMVSKLDKILKSLLEDIKIDGFTLTSNDNVLASVLTVASEYIGSENTSAVLQLLDKYLAIFESTADSDGNLSKDVYNNTKLNEIVISTYQVIENIADYVLYQMDNAPLKEKDPYQVIVGAIDGVISPESVAVRMSSDYSKAADSLMGKKSWKEVSSINFSISKGDKDAFYSALGQSVSGIAAIVSALLTCSYTDTTHTDNYYSSLVYPLLDTVATHTGASGVATPEEFTAMSAQDQLVKGIMAPLSNIIGKLYDAPATFLVNLVNAIGDIAQDDSVKNYLNVAVAPINNLYNEALDGIVAGVLKAPILDIGAKMALIDYMPLDLTKLLKLPTQNIIYNLVANIEVGGETLESLLNLRAIDWSLLANSKSAGETLSLIYNYLKETVLQSETVISVLESVSPELTKLLNKLEGEDVFNLVTKILNVAQSPTEAYWTFKQYAEELTHSFVYPTNVTASEANEAVDALDKIVDNVFPLLSSLGIDIGANSLEGLVNNNLYTNSLITTITTAAYGALEDVGSQVGLDFSPSAVASYLTDSSYGKTFSRAANTISSARSWSSISSIDWGFADGSQTGFKYALAAALRPLNDVLGILLTGDSSAIQNVVKSLDLNIKLHTPTETGNQSLDCTVTLIIKNGVLEIDVLSENSGETSTATVNIANLLGLGSNGYEGAIIPLLEAFKCDGIKTNAQYLSDYAEAKDNLILDILNPLFGFVDDVIDAPADTLTGVLPNLAYFISNNGIGQFVKNLLAPVTGDNGLIGILNDAGINIDDIIKAILGTDLGTYLTNTLGIDANLTLNLSDLSTCNVQDIVMPLVRKILSNAGLNIKLSDISFSYLASLGTIETVSSKAKNANGNYTTLQVEANKGQVFITILRYVADVLIRNANTINNLLQGIDGIKSNSTICSVLDCIFSSINTASKDDIVRAIMYFLVPTGGTMNVAGDSFFDYTNFKTDSSDFSFGDMDEDFCRQLAPMLDGLISGLLGDQGGLLGLIEGIVYNDDIISTIACGLYSAVESVDLGSLGSLTDLLEKTGIDFSTSNVAALLTDKSYGDTYSSAASTISRAGKWSNVSKSSLSWGVTDRDSFLKALAAVLRPLYGVLDVILNDGKLNLFNVVSVPGSDGYSSVIVPLLEAFGCYNIKTQYDYRMDMNNVGYDAILLDILNPIMDKVEDILNAPVEMVADILPNLSLFFANDGLLQIINNLMTPVSALLDAIKPIVNVNNILKVLGVNINSLLSSIGINTSTSFDIYDLKGSLEPLIGSENVVSLLNGILSSVKISGQSLGIVLPEIDWYALASHGTVIQTYSQAATHGQRLYVQADQDETLIAVLRFVINTVNYDDNYNAIVSLVSGLLSGLGDSVAGVIDQVLGMLEGDADEVIENLVDLLQSVAG